FLDKPGRRLHRVDVNYTGFTFTGDGFVVGYGLDYAGRYRNLPFIALLEPEDR
ncbi:MAG: hypoxanthine phosphoribosyltransferase, partial [bacterium]|nr:hypoxanthine phosphoribosyltransferase [bacterium]